MNNLFILILLAFVVFIIIAAYYAKRGSQRPGEGSKYSSSHFYADPHMTNFDPNHDSRDDSCGSPSHSIDGDSGSGGDSGGGSAD